MGIVTNDSEPGVLSEEPIRKLRVEELDLVTGGQGVVIHSEIVIVKVLDKSSPL